MSLTAHPYVVLAEQQWKQESLGGANRAPRRTPSGPGRVRTAARLVLAALATQRHDGPRPDGHRPGTGGGRHTARPV